MVPDISTGSRTYGLLAYLYGPGRRDEHTAPHIVAAWEPFLAPDPGRDPAATLKQLTDRLDLPVLALPAGRRPARHVWHCPVRTAPGDRPLTDAEWGEVARRIVHATGIAPEGDDQACRWVAVRHAPDHIHIVATLKRQDGRSPHRHNDSARAQAECRQIEKDFGLQRLNPGDRTAAQRPTSAERSKAERTGRAEPPREILRETVRQSLAGAATEDEFFARLTAAGLRVEQRIAPSGDALGYKVALPGDRNRAGEPVWFSGSKLAPDLSLPKIRQRLEADALDAEEGPRLPPAAARRDAVTPVVRAAAVLDQDDEEGTAVAHLVGTGELLDALAKTAPATTRRELSQAARAFERATRTHERAARADHRALRTAARGLLRAGDALGRGEDGGTTAMVLSTLILVTLAAARWHSAHGHAQQAAAARQAAQHLRIAYQTAAAPPLKAMRHHAYRLPKPVRDQHTTTVTTALPEYADQLRQETGWDALIATLDQAQAVGHDPTTLLRTVIGQRELDTADNVNDVLIWRIRHTTGLPTAPKPVTDRTSVRTRAPKPAEAPARTIPTPSGQRRPRR
ncbi:relaxase/mobilization nuclease domain-containing protein [Streptomyces yaizuensis]|uniref:relaxase/mobilization nuclease domain-containing protein n=1 Tax=Streptomyces yaizuensis TaxID=2989713 RepID=UPI002B21936B|nr:mobilization protein [Streptomyces sp. YSPA8]